jgi:hypothetical protein
VNACALRLQSAARERYLPFIEREFPALWPRYRATYARGYQVGERYRAGLRRQFARLCGKYGVPFGHREDDEERDSSVRAPSLPLPPEIEVQLALPL